MRATVARLPLLGDPTAPVLLTEVDLLLFTDLDLLTDLDPIVADSRGLSALIYCW